MFPLYCRLSLLSAVLVATGAAATDDLHLEATATTPLRAPDSASPASSWLRRAPEGGWKAEPNFTPQVRYGQLAATEGALRITQAANPRPQDERSVQSLYYGYLGRLPGEFEISLQSSAVRAGTDLASALLQSPEFEATGKFVAGAYLGLFDRVPEYDGWRFQLDALAGGQATQRQFLGRLLTSPEWRQRHPNLDQTAFVQLLYRNLLRREPSPEELALQVKAVGPGYLDQCVSVALSILTSPEFANRSGGEMLPAEAGRASSSLE